METRTLKVLTGSDIQRVADTYHAWREVEGAYRDAAGFCVAATSAEIEAKGYSLSPGRYVGSAELDDEGGEPFDQRFKQLKATLEEQMQEACLLDKRITDALKLVVTDAAAR